MSLIPIKLRFAFASAMSGSPWGGSEELWSQAALRLRRLGHKVSASVVWWPEISTRVIDLARDGIEVLFDPRSSAKWTARIWRRLNRRLTISTQKHAMLLERKPDLVIISQGGNLDGYEWMKVCCEAAVPFVAIVQCNYENWWPTDMSSGDVAAVYHAAKRVFCVSRRNLELLEFQIGEVLPNASVVWNPYNVPTDRPLSWPAENGLWRLACVARLDPAAKGHDILFQVLSRPQWRDRNVEVNLYGEGHFEKGLKRLAARFELKNVHFRGHVNDVKGIWEKNQLLVLPSRYEGLPLALVEAMWCGRPAVVTDIGGNAELCLEGKTGFVAAAPVMGLFEDALERAWGLRYNWSEMGSAARIRAEQVIPRDPVGLFCNRLMECVSGQTEEGYA